MRKKISSQATFFIKFIFPAIWLIGFGQHMLSDLPKSFIEMNPDLFLSIGFFLVGVIIFGLLAFPLKEVFIDEEFIYLSNYFREDKISLRHIERVSETFLTNPKLVIVRFKDRTIFGKRIIFIPQDRWFAPLRKHPIVNDIKDLVNNATKTQ